VKESWSPGQGGPWTNGPRTNGQRTNGPRKLLDRLRGASSPATVLLAAAGVCILLAGCATTKAYEREALADVIMERQNPFSKQTLEQKFFTTREGSIGGSAGIGGGCGCAK
jgi:hypothetical protein